ncbi:hypothetical protein ACFLZW_04905 [Chloroflexota bacterium]
MVKNDKFLVGIVIGILVLVLVTVVYVMMQSAPEYMSEDTAAGVAHNYLLALQFEDYERALSYIAPCVQGVPQDPDAFGRLVERDSGFYGLRRDVSLLVEETFEQNEKTLVRVNQTRFESGDPFDSRIDQKTFLMSVDLFDGNWRVYHSEKYWDRSWKVKSCP